MGANQSPSSFIVMREITHITFESGLSSFTL